jgi:hypothetical protein
LFSAIRALYLNVFDQVHAAILGWHFEFQARRVAPQVFQRIICALLLRENVHHHFPVVRHDPLALGKSVDGQRLHVVILPKSFLQLIGDCLEVRLACPGADEEEVGKR